MISFKNFLSEEFKLTLKYHKNLNPKLWKHDVLKNEISDQLLQLSYVFAAFAGIPKNSIVDIVITGGNANYNYTKFSDIDVHLICTDTGKTADELYKSKVDWASEYSDLKIAAYPLEFFAHPIEEAIKPGQGAWSLVNHKWVVVPKHLDDVAVLRDARVIKKVQHQIAVIRDLLKRGTPEQIEEYRGKMKTMRAAGLEHGGEFSVENIIYKDLRNRGLLQRLAARRTELENKNRA